MNETKSTTYSYAGRDYLYLKDVYDQYSNFVVKVQLTKSRSGTGLKGWRSIIANGGNATTGFTGSYEGVGHVQPYSTYLIRYRIVDGVREVYSINRTENRVDMPGFWMTNASATTANNQALKYLHKAIREQRTTQQGAIFLGEAREAFRMLSSPAKALRQGISDYLGAVERRSKGSKKKSRKKIVSETWLEYSFGWIPFASDIADAAKALNKIYDEVRLTRVTRTGVEAFSQNVLTNSAQSIGPNMAGIIDEDRKSTVKVRYICGMRNYSQGARPTSALERFGLTASQFLPTLWELTPWSFLVDYFTNIGDILDAGATNTSDVIWTCKTVRRETVNTRRVRINSIDMALGYPGDDFGGTSGSFSLVGRDIERSKVLDIPLPRFEVSIPSSPIKWINMAALGIAQHKLSLQLNR